VPGESAKDRSREREHQMVRLPSDLHSELKERARAEDLNLSQALRRAVRAYLQSPPPSAVA